MILYDKKTHTTSAHSSKKKRKKKIISALKKINKKYHRILRRLAK